MIVNIDMLKVFNFKLFFSNNFLKYNKKVNNSIHYKYIQNKFSISGNYNASLFCINIGSIYYYPIFFFKTRIIMEYLYPNPADYEVIIRRLNYFWIRKILIKIKVWGVCYRDWLKGSLDTYLPINLFLLNPQSKFYLIIKN